MSGGLSARLEINGQRVASLETGETYTNFFDAGNVVITTDNWTTPGKFTLALNAEAGTEYKLELSPRGESVMAWAVPGFKDTLLRCLMEPEVFDGATQEVF